MQDKIITGVATALATTAALGLVEWSTNWFSNLLTKSPLPQGMIVMTDLECAKLTGGWSEYTAADGRFPIGEGTGNDGIIDRSFSRGNTGGTYEHVLTLQEMPAHDHEYMTKQDDRVQSGSTTAVWWQNQVARTSITGGLPDGTTKPHNNVPPYVVLNFCIKE